MGLASSLSPTTICPVIGMLMSPLPLLSRLLLLPSEDVSSSPSTKKRREASFSLLSNGPERGAEGGLKGDRGHVGTRRPRAEYIRTET